MTYCFLFTLDLCRSDAHHMLVLFQGGKSLIHDGGYVTPVSEAIFVSVNWNIYTPFKSSIYYSRQASSIPHTNAVCKLLDREKLFSFKLITNITIIPCLTSAY